MPNVKPAFPEFGTATPGMGSPHYVAPTGTQQTNGYAATSGEFTRGLRNWLDTHSYLSLTWLDDVRFAWSALDGDESDGGGWAITSSITQPTTGAGLTGTSGALEAEFNGRHVVLSSAAKVYTASKDTYVDIDNEGTITYTEVSNGAGAPALGSGKFRCFKVVTNGSDRTAATTLAVQVPRITQGLELGDTLIAQGADFADEVTFADHLSSAEALTGNPVDVGKSTARFRTFYGSGIDVTGDAMKSHLIPSSDTTYDLGSTSKEYRAVYATAHKYRSAKPFRYTLSAADFKSTQHTNVDDWQYVANDDPTNAGHYLHYAAPGVSSGMAVAQLDLPNGAIITNAAVLTNITTDVASYAVRAAVVRRPLGSIAAGDNLSTVDPTTGELLANGATNNVLTIDALTAVKTVNRSSYLYELWVWAEDVANVKLYSAYVDGTVTELVPR